jgi:hypothetical protein
MTPAERITAPITAVRRIARVRELLGKDPAADPPEYLTLLEVIHELVDLVEELLDGS